MADFLVLMKIMSKLQKASNSNWINEIEETDIVPFMITRYLSMSYLFMPYANLLNQSLHLPPKQFLLYAWSIVPKKEKAIRLNYIKKFVEENVVEDVIFNKIKKILDIGENDWKHEKKYFERDLAANKTEYFKMFGVEKKYWGKAQLNFEDIKGEEGEIKGKSGLELFGL